MKRFKECAAKNFLSPKSSKGIIEVQFGWIFAVIAGAIIFAFIITIVVNNQKQANTTLNIDVGQKLTTAIKGNIQVSDSTNMITLLSSAKLSFACDTDRNVTTMRMNDAPLAEEFNDVIFAPSTLETNKLLVGVKDFSLGFIVSRFSYITKPDTIYLIYYQTAGTQEQAMAMQLLDLMPVNITKKVVSNAELATYMSQYKNYKIICFNNACPTPTNSYTYTRIDAMHNYLDGFGNVSWMSKGVGQKSAFLTSASMIGGIFSDSKDYYDCEMGRAFEILEIKRLLQYNRLLQMTPDLNQYNFQCVPLIAQHEYILTNMSNLTYAPFLYNDATLLRAANQDSGFQGCPKVS